MAFKIDVTGNVLLQIYERILLLKEAAEKSGDKSRLQAWTDMAQTASIANQANLLFGSPTQVLQAQEFMEKTRAFIAPTQTVTIQLASSTFTLTPPNVYCCTPDESITILNESDRRRLFIERSDLSKYIVNPAIQAFYA